jgi:hypothetical protein
VGGISFSAKRISPEWTRKDEKNFVKHRPDGKTCEPKLDTLQEQNPVMAGSTDHDGSLLFPMRPHDLLNDYYFV